MRTSGLRLAGTRLGAVTAVVLGGAAMIFWGIAPAVSVQTTPSAEAAPVALTTAGASVAILNASGWSDASALAAGTLTKHGFGSGDVVDSTADVARSVVLYAHTWRAKARPIAMALGMPMRPFGRVRPVDAPAAPILIVLGHDAG